MTLLQWKKQSGDFLILKINKVQDEYEANKSNEEYLTEWDQFKRLRQKSYEMLKEPYFLI